MSKKTFSFRGMVASALLGKQTAALLEKAGEANFFGRIEELERLGLAGGRTESGATVNEETSMRYAAVYTAIRILSEIVGMLPLHLMASDDAGNTTKATDDGLYDVLYRTPNRWMTAFDFWRIVMVHLLLRGNFYGYIRRNGNGEAREIVPINGDRLKIEMLDTWELKYTYTPASGQKPVVLEQGDILHIRAVGTDGILGKSPVAQAREAIGIGIQTEKMAAKMFSNGTRMGIVVKHPEVLSDEVHARLLKSINDAYAGVENAHKTVLLEEGMTVEKISMTAEDSQFIEQRKMQRSEVLALYGIPPHMAGDTEKTTSWGSGIEQQTIGFVTFTLMPWLVNIEQAIYRDVLTAKQRKKYYARFNSDAIIRGDILSRYKAHQIGVLTGFLNRNEVRQMENRNTAPGLDEFVDPQKAAPSTQNDGGGDTGSGSNDSGNKP